MILQLATRILPWAALGLLGAGCSPRPPFREITIRARDYAFESPESLPAGPVAFGFENAGTVRHEIKVIALKPGVTFTEVLRADAADADLAPLVEPTSGILTAYPGKTTPGRILVSLQAGRDYILVCGFQDSDSAMPHDKLGMLRGLHSY